MNTTMQLPDMMIQSGLVRGAPDGLKPGKCYRVTRGKFRSRTCTYIAPHGLPSNHGRRIAGEWSGRVRVQFCDTKREAVAYADQLTPDP